MSTQLFPSLLGLGWTVKRTPLWKTRKQESISGKRTSIADWSYPRWQWELTYDFLRQAGAGQQAATFQGAAYAEFAALAGFFNLRSGGFDSFLYADPDDNGVTNQPIAITDGTTSQFQLVRAFGGFVEPIFAPNIVSAVRLNGVPLTSGVDYAINGWGQPGASPGMIVALAGAPAAGSQITADFSYYFPCQFDEDGLSFEKFMQALYLARSVKFSSLK